MRYRMTMRQPNIIVYKLTKYKKCFDNVQPRRYYLFSKFLSMNIESFLLAHTHIICTIYKSILSHE